VTAFRFFLLVLRILAEALLESPAFWDANKEEGVISSFPLTVKEESHPTMDATNVKVIFPKRGGTITLKISLPTIFSLK